VPNFPSGQPDWNSHKFYRHVCNFKLQALPYVRSGKLQFVKMKEFELFMEGRELRKKQKEKLEMKYFSFYN